MHTSTGIIVITEFIIILMVILYAREITLKFITA